MSRNAVVVGTGSYHPKKFLDHDYFRKLFTEKVDKFFDKTQIIGKYVCADDESSLDLAVNASKQAIENAGIKPEDIDLIILSTDTPAFLSPATSVGVQHLIGATNAGTFDINAACAGFVTAMSTAWQYIRNDKKYNHVLVIGTYAMTKYVEETDPFTSPLLGDGAGAIILKADESDSGRGIHATKLFARGEYYNMLGIFGGGSANPASPEMLERKEQYVRFLGKFPSDINEAVWPQMIKDVCEEANFNLSDIDWTVLTQVNHQTIVEVHKTLEIPYEKAITIMQKYGYTGSACIPMAIHEAVMDKKFKENDLIAMCASGGGANFASLVMKW